jgi:hypothetical protein
MPIFFYLLLGITIEFDKHLAKMTDPQPFKFKKLIITATYNIAKNFVISKFRQWGVLRPDHMSIYLLVIW